MANQDKDIIFKNYATEAAAIAALADDRAAFAIDTKRWVWMNGATPVYYWDATSLAGQTSILGAAVIGHDGIAGVTPDGGSSGAAATVRAMLRGGLGTGNANFIHNGTSQQASSNFNISGNGKAAGYFTGISDRSGGSNTGAFRSPESAGASSSDPTTITTHYGFRAQFSTGYGVSLEAWYGAAPTMGLLSWSAGTPSAWITRLNGATITTHTGDWINTGSMTLSGLSSGRIPVVSTSGLLIQDNLYWDASNDRIGIGSGASSPPYDISVVRALAGNAMRILLDNTDNTNAASGSIIHARTGGASAGDAYLLLSNVGNKDWSVALDRSDSYSFVISESDTPGTNNRLKIAAGGNVTIPGVMGIGADPGTSQLAVIKNIAGDLTVSFLNSNTTSSSRVKLQLASDYTAGGSAGDVWFELNRSGANIWAHGMDASDGDAYVFSIDGILGTNNCLRIGTDGDVALGLNSSFTGTLSGFTAGVTGTCYYTKIGNLVSLYIPTLTGTSNSTACVLSGIPAAIRPATRAQPHVVQQIRNNGTDYPGLVFINTDGTMDVYYITAIPGTWTQTFTNSGAKGISSPIMVTYAIT